MAMDQQFVQESKATLFDFPEFSAEKDAEKLRDAMKGLGTKEIVIIEIAAYRTLRQRLEIECAYKQKYGRDLKEDFKSDLSGHFEDTVLAMFYTANVRDASFLYKAMKCLGTDEDCLIEILTTRTNYRIEQIKEAYKEEYGKDLEAAIKDDTSCHFKEFLVSLLQGNRDEGRKIDCDLAKKDAKCLFEAGEKFWGTDEQKFIEIFCNRSFPQLRATFAEYEKIAGKSIKKAISKEFSGDLEAGLKTIIEIAHCRPYYFARKLKHAMERPGTDDHTILRIVVTRCEHDMFQIKEEFLKLAGKSLIVCIKDDTSGDFKEMLLRLVGE